MKLTDKIKEVLGIHSPSKEAQRFYNVICEEFQKSYHESICDTRDAGWTGLNAQNAGWKGGDARDASKRDVI